MSSFVNACFFPLDKVLLMCGHVMFKELSRTFVYILSTVLVVSAYFIRRETGV